MKYWWTPSRLTPDQEDCWTREDTISLTVALAFLALFVWSQL